ncbi:MAG: radical SAM protein [Oligoflexia bacterium]|nr:radical SAM protein [Oligoflexia bacterium]
MIGHAASWNFLRKQKEYEELKELAESWGITYGPIKSRRLGVSLGINLLGSGEKICSFNCPYCELGFTKLKMSEMKKAANYPTLEQLEAALRIKIVELTKNDVKLDSLSIVGNGEPTMYPLFPEAVEVVKKVRNELTPESKVGILTNGSTLQDAKVIKGLNMLDDRMIKLDAGNDAMLEKVDAPLVRMSINKLIQGTKKLNDVILQSFFVQGVIDNTTPGEIEDWIEVVGIIKPKLVHIYSLDRVPPLAGLKQVPSQKLKEISEKLEKKTMIKSLVFA